MLGIVRNLTVPIILCTSFIDKFIKGNFPGERKTVPFNYPPALIFMLYVTESDMTKEQQDDIVAKILAEEGYNRELLRVERIVTRKPLIETAVFVATNTRGIVRIDDSTKFEQSYPCKVAHGVIEVF